MKKHLFLASLTIVTLLSSCKKSEDDAAPAPSYDVPTAYRFSNQLYTDAPGKFETTRLGMFKAMEAKMALAIPKASNLTASASDSAFLVEMYTNTSSRFDTLRWNSSGLDLASENADPELVKKYLGKYAAASAAATYNGTATPPPTAAEGTAGLGANASNAYQLFDKYGINYAQMQQKSQFGSLIIYQIITRLEALKSLDNSTPITVSGKTFTAQEHAWDEAFGYAGFPTYSIDSLTTPTIASTISSKFFYVGNYSRQTDNTTDLNATKTLVTAFIKGRAAVSHKDNDTRNNQIQIIETCLRKILGAMVLQEYTEYEERKVNNAARNGVVSEMIGMVVGMKYVPGKIISDTQIEDLLTHLHANDTDHGIWQISDADVDYVKDQVVSIFGVNLK